MRLEEEAGNVITRAAQLGQRTRSEAATIGDDLYFAGVFQVAQTWEDLIQAQVGWIGRPETDEDVVDRIAFETRDEAKTALNHHGAWVAITNQYLENFGEQLLQEDPQRLEQLTGTFDLIASRAILLIDALQVDPVLTAVPVFFEELGARVARGLERIGKPYEPFFDPPGEIVLPVIIGAGGGAVLAEVVSGTLIGTIMGLFAGGVVGAVYAQFAKPENSSKEAE